MSFLETILLPKNAEVPHSVTFYKRIHEDTDIIGKKVKVYSTYGMPFTSTVHDCRLYDDIIVVSLDDLSADSIENTIVEVSEIDRKLQIGDFAEDRLVQLLRHDSTLSKRIPQVIRDRPSFKRKIELKKTQLNIKGVDSTARRTGIIDIPKSQMLICKLSMSF